MGGGRGAPFFDDECYAPCETDGVPRTDHGNRRVPAACGSAEGVVCVRRGGQEALEDGRLAEVEGGRVEPAPGGSDLRESDAKVCWGIGRLEVDVCGNAECLKMLRAGGEGPAAGGLQECFPGESSAKPWSWSCLIFRKQRNPVPGHRA